MKKSDFIRELQERAVAQQKLRKEIPFPEFFAFIGTSLGNHPWKPLIPLSVLASIFFYIIFGKSYIEFVLWVFKVI